MAAAVLVAALVPTTAATAHATTPDGSHRPDTYVVSTVPGTSLEGIHVTRDGTMYVTSVATGAVYIGSTKSPRLRVHLPAGGNGRTAATGVHTDRWGRLLVAGADTDAMYLYDGRGRLVSKRSVPDGSFLNDFTIVGDTVYITDSNQGIVWKASLTARGLGGLSVFLRPGSTTPRLAAPNGIVSSPDGRVLLIGDGANEVTFRVDIRTRRAQVVTTGSRPLFGDGFLLEGHTLYAVLNYEAGDGYDFVVRKVQMSGDWTRARFVADSDPAPLEEGPTTIARDRGRLLWVNSQVYTQPGTPPYTVTKVPGLR